MIAPSDAARAPRSFARLCLKWTLLVTLNAALGFVAALLTDHDSSADILAMLLGIITFICIYAGVDEWAFSRGRDELLKSLKMGVVIKMIMQVIPGVEVAAGAVAHAAVQWLGLEKTVLVEHRSPLRAFFRTYVETVVVGAILSLVVAIITALILYVRHLAMLRKAHRPLDAPS